MAPSSLCCLLLILFPAVTTSQNTTNYDFNTTFGDQNITEDDYYYSNTVTQPTETDWSTGTPTRSSTEGPVRPTAPAEPLALSGGLLDPVTAVGSLCPCDIQQDECDVNCCCDRACSEEIALFTHCTVDSVSGQKQLCSHDVASYSLRSTVDGFSELHTSVQKQNNYDVFCIQAQNRVQGLSHPSPELPTDRNFDSLFQRFSNFMFGSENDDVASPPADVQASGYQFGDVMDTVDRGGQRGTFWLPAAGVTAECLDASPAAFLKDQVGVCSRSLILDQDCESLSALNMKTYTDVQLLAGKNKDAAVLPVDVSSVVLQSLEGTQSELDLSAGDQDLDLDPVLLSPDLCANVVLKVSYVLSYTPPGELLNVSVSLVLGFVRGAALTLDQQFDVTFIQEDVGGVAFKFSGNPGYLVGLPLVAGTRTPEGISRSLDPTESLSLVHSTQDQDCLQGPDRRSPVRFGLDYVSGCTLRLDQVSNCSLVSQRVLEVLRGGSNQDLYVASFGNSPLENPLDWVPVERSYSPTAGCSVPLALHLDVEWTRYGSLRNPQAQILRVTESIQTNASRLDWLSGGGGVVAISSSVAFVSVSADALPGYRATPTIDAKLPFDFFFPFV